MIDAISKLVESGAISEDVQKASKRLGIRKLKKTKKL